MSKATKRKHVTKEILEDYYEPEDEESIVKIIGGRGNNLHEVEATDRKKYLVSMPTKFRRNVWVKRGDFVVVSPVKEGVKVQGEIVYILYPKQVKYLKNEGKWPIEFNDSLKDLDGQNAVKEDQSNTSNNSNNNRVMNDNDSDSESSDNDDDLFQNPNHRTFVRHNDDDDDETSSDEDSSDNENNEHMKNTESAVEHNLTEKLQNL